MAFNIPVQTSFSQLRPITGSAPFVRPVDWITITDTPNVVQFLVSSSVYPAYNIQTTFTQTGGVGNIYINWGDGTSTTVSTTTATNSEKTYTSGGTPCSLGYDTWKITISGDAGTRITVASFFNPSYWGSAVQQPTGVLEEYYGDGTILTAGALHYAAATKPIFSNLVYSKLPTIMSGSTSLQNSYLNCFVINTIVLPTSMPGCGGMDSAFGGCYFLSNITIPQDATGIGSMAASFQNCYELTSVTLPPTLNSVNSMLNTFQNCYSLKSIILPATPNNANYATTFNNCYDLLSVEINSFGTSASINCSNMFATCTSLEYIKLPTTVSGSSVFDISGMFNGCSNLKSCILPTNMNASTMASTFLNCASLGYVSLPTSMASLTSLNQTFSGCRNLSEITLPTTIGANIDVANAFTTCSGLSTITIPSGWTLTNMGSTFQNCYALRSVVLPSGAQNSISSLNSTFLNCYNLQSITMPSSMNALTVMTNAFAACYSLTGVTYPASLPLVNNFNTAHQNNYSLQNITLPTSMSACTTFAGSFNGCWRLSGVTLPSTVSTSVISLQNCFLNCYTIKNITLPTTQMIGITASGGNAIFQNCYSLTGLTNTVRLGNTSTTSGATGNYSTFLTNTFELNQTLSFSGAMAAFAAPGISTRSTKLSGLRFFNTRGSAAQWGGSSPQIDISYTSLSTAALNTLFADIAAQGNVTSKTINITGALGAAGLSAGDRLVLTSKGWTITG
jgi:hypothetical protein